MTVGVEGSRQIFQTGEIIRTQGSSSECNPGLEAQRLIYVALRRKRAMTYRRKVQVGRRCYFEKEEEKGRGRKREGKREKKGKRKRYPVKLKVFNVILSKGETLVAANNLICLPQGRVYEKVYGNKPAKVLLV
jgi:hypothetical protein